MNNLQGKINRPNEVPWHYFLLTDNLDELYTVLRYQYGINVNEIINKANIYTQISESAKIKHLLESSENAVKDLFTDMKQYMNMVSGWRIQINPENIWDNDKQKKLHTYNLYQYLAVDALLNLKLEPKSAMKDDLFYKSFSEFFSVCSEILDADEMQYAKKLRAMRSSGLGWHIGFTDDQEEKERRIQFPKQLDMLTYHLIGTYNTSPFSGPDFNDSWYQRYCKFIGSKELMELINKSYKKDKASRIISLYLMERLYCCKGLSYLSDRLTEYINNPANRVPIRTETIAEYLTPFYFVPNCFSQRYYIDNIMSIISGENEFDLFRAFEKNPRILAENREMLSDIAQMEHNLEHSRQYLLFLTTTYLPLLSASFCLAVLKSFGSKEAAVNALTAYVDDKLIDKMFTIDSLATQLDGDSQKTFNILFERIMDELTPSGLSYWKLTTAVDYLRTEEYRNDIFATTMKERFGPYQLKIITRERNNRVKRRFTLRSEKQDIVLVDCIERKVSKKKHYIYYAVYLNEKAEVTAIDTWISEKNKAWDTFSRKMSDSGLEEVNYIVSDHADAIKRRIHSSIKVGHCVPHMVALKPKIKCKKKDHKKAGRPSEFKGFRDICLCSDITDCVKVQNELGNDEKWNSNQIQEILELISEYRLMPQKQRVRIYSNKIVRDLSKCVEQKSNYSMEALECEVEKAKDRVLAKYGSKDKK